MSKILGALTNKKYRPFIIGGAVIIGGVVLFAMLRGSGSATGNAVATSSGPSEALQAAGLQAQTQLAIAQLQSNVESTRLATELEAFMFGKQKDTELAIYQTQGATNIQLAGIQAQENIAGFAAQTQQYGIEAQKLIAIEGQKSQVEIAKLQAGVQSQGIKAQSKSNTLGTIASIATAAFAIFSDRRAKKGFSWTGIRVYDGVGKSQPVELNQYEYEYVGTWGMKHNGMIAQDIAMHYPSRVMPTNHGNRWLAVDMDAL